MSEPVTSFLKRLLRHKVVKERLAPQPPSASTPINKQVGWEFPGLPGIPAKPITRIVDHMVVYDHSEYEPPETCDCLYDACRYMRYPID